MSFLLYPLERMRLRDPCAVFLCAMLPMVVAASERVLPALISEAIAAHPTVRAARAAQDVAVSEVQSARWQYFPTPSVSVQHAGKTTDPAAGDKAVTVLRLQQTLWAAGRLDRGVERAEAKLRGRQSALEESRQQIALDVIQAFGELHVSRLKLSAIEQSLAKHRQLLQQIERRIAEGLSPRSDRALAASRLEQVSSELSVYRAQANSALTRLEQLLGRPVALDEWGDVIAPREVQGDAALLRERALHASPQLKRALAESDALAAEVGVTAAAQWPVVTLGVERQMGATYRGGPEGVTRVVFGLQSDFGAGLSVWSNKVAADARARAAVDESDAVRRTIIEQIERDRINLASLQLRRDALRSAISEAAEVRESYDRQFLVGGKSWMDVMNAARESAQLTVQKADLDGALVVVSWRLSVATSGVDELVRSSVSPAVPTPQGVSATIPAKE